MKIALLHYATSPVIGGVERILHAHARIFRECGHEVATFSQRGDADYAIKPSGTKEGYLEELGAALASFDAVIVHNVMTMPFDLPLTEALAELAQTHRPPRWIAWVHDLAAVNPDLQPAPEILARAAKGIEYIAISLLRASQFHEITGVVPEVIPNGINPAEILCIPAAVAAFAERHSLFDGRPVLLHPTRLLRRKNVELGLAVIQSMQASQAVLLVTGAEDPHNSASREYAAWLRAESKRLGVARSVIFVTDELVLSDENAFALFQVADALFLPSRQEGFGLPVLEAAIHRMLSFVADIEPLATLAGPNTRLFSLQETPEAIARLIWETLACDPSTTARKEALSYRWSRICETRLKRLLAGSTPRL